MTESRIQAQRSRARARAQRDRALAALEQLAEYVKRVGGYMSPEDQARLRAAEQVLKEPRA